MANMYSLNGMLPTGNMGAPVMKKPDMFRTAATGDEFGKRQRQTNFTEFEKKRKTRMRVPDLVNQPISTKLGFK